MALSLGAWDRQDGKAEYNSKMEPGGGGVVLTTGDSFGREAKDEGALRTTRGATGFSLVYVVGVGQAASAWFNPVE